MSAKTTSPDPYTDPDWIAGPDNWLRYVVLGEEGDEDLMIYGHSHDDDTIREVIQHAGLGLVLADIVINGVKVADGTKVAELRRLETWARKRRDCRTHRILPHWFRHLMILWATNARHLPPLVDRIENCQDCVHVDHYRTCQGCGWCAGTGKVPPWWVWAVRKGAPANANAGRAGYHPVTVVELRG